jgi:hypothetical protein
MGCLISCAAPQFEISPLRYHFIYSFNIFARAAETKYITGMASGDFRLKQSHRLPSVFRIWRHLRSCPFNIPPMNIQPSRDYDLNQKITELLQARIDHH